MTLIKKWKTPDEIRAMSRLKRTDGQWRVVIESSYLRVAVDTDGLSTDRMICTVASASQGDVAGRTASREDALGNAALLAAAPVTSEACQEASEGMETLVGMLNDTISRKEIVDFAWGLQALLRGAYKKSVGADVPTGSWKNHG